MKSSLELISIVLAAILVSCYTQIFRPLNPTQIPSASPDTAPPQTAILVCGIEGNATNYSSSWTTPTGTFIENGQFGRPTFADNQKYILQNGNIRIENLNQGSVLVVMRLMYSDAGKYVCSITFRDTGTTVNNSSMLILNVFARILGPETRSVTVGENVSISCEMSGYLRNDSDLVWMKGDKRLMEDTIISDGTPMRGQIGGINSVPSRVSTLTITDIRESDEGVYTCLVIGTEEEATVELNVTDTGQTTQSITTFDSDLTNTDTSDKTAEITTLPALFTPDGGNSSPTASISTLTVSPAESQPLSLVVGIIAGIVGFLAFILTIISLTSVMCLHWKQVTTAKHEQPNEEEVMSTREVVARMHVIDRIEAVREADDGGEVQEDGLDWHIYEEVEELYQYAPEIGAEGTDRSISFTEATDDVTIIRENSNIKNRLLEEDVINVEENEAYERTSNTGEIGSEGCSVSSEDIAVQDNEAYEKNSYSGETGADSDGVLGENIVLKDNEAYEKDCNIGESGVDSESFLEEATDNAIINITADTNSSLGENIDVKAFEKNPNEEYSNNSLKETNHSNPAISSSLEEIYVKHNEAYVNIATTTVRDSDNLTDDFRDNQGYENNFITLENDAIGTAATHKK